MTRCYDVVHVTTYTYDDEVTESYGRATLTPRQGAGQQVLRDRLHIDPGPELVRRDRDFYGNASAYFEVLTAHTVLEVTAESRVSVRRHPPDLDDPDSPAATISWERAAESLRAGHGAAWSGPGQVSDEEALWENDFRLPSKHVPIEAAVGEFASSVFRPGRPVATAVRDLVRVIHREFRYRPGATTVRTTPAEVLEHREGVCQDFAHLAIGALRAQGLAARYVSGYLETVPPPGRPKLLGADASHAWVSVLLPGLGWVDLDPTNDKLVDERYVTTAWGRDYADVPPLKGVIYADGALSTLSVAVDVVPVDDPERADFPVRPGKRTTTSGPDGTATSGPDVTTTSEPYG